VLLAYSVSRFIGLLLTIPCLFLTIFQLYFLRQYKIRVEIKYYVHYCMLLCIISLIFSFIDPDGVFGILPFSINLLAVGVAGVCVESAFCFVIFCHLHAHYLALKKQTPSWLPITLVCGMVFSVIGSIIAQTLTYTLNKEVYSSLADMKAILWLLLVLGTDSVAYYLVRNLVLLGLQQEKGFKLAPQDDNSSKKTGVHATVKYSDLLKRMRYFHVPIFTLGLGFMINDCIKLKNDLHAGDNPPSYPSPDSFGFNNTVYSFLILIIWALFTSWAWVPLHSESEEHVSAQVSTNESNVSRKNSSQHHGSKNSSQHRGSKNSSQHHGSNDVCPPTFYTNVLFDSTKNEENSEEEPIGKGHIGDSLTSSQHGDLSPSQGYRHILPKTVENEQEPMEIEIVPISAVEVALNDSMDQGTQGKQSEIALNDSLDQSTQGTSKQAEIASFNDSLDQSINGTDTD